MHLPIRSQYASEAARPGDATLVDVCRTRAAAQPEDWIYTFLEDEGESVLTYAELDAGARAVAALLQRHLAPGDRALLLYPPGREYAFGFLGCLYAGVVAVPAYPPDPMRLGRTLPRLQSLVADCGARVALTTSGIADMVEPLTEGAPDLRALRWLATDTVAPAEAAAWRAPALSGESVAFLQYTSGSTGTPRGVVLRHRHLLHNSWLIARGFDASPNAVGVLWLPPYHDMGLIGGLLQPLYRDFPMVLLPPLSFLQRPMGWLEAVSRYGGSVCGAPNFAFDLCVRKSTPAQRAALDLSRWESAFCGAEPVRADTLERFAEAFAPAGFRREAFYPCYGLAEGTLIVSGGVRAAAPVVRRFSREGLLRGEARAPEAESAEAVLVGCGQVLGDQDVRVVDPVTRRPCPPGRVGELWVRGPSVADGYWQRPEETERTFHGRLADSGEGPYLRTGDLGVIEDGEVFVTGRAKDVLVLRGRNHYPQDLEQSAERCHPGVRPGCGAAFLVEEAGEERLVLVQEVAAKVAADGAVAEVVTRIRAALSEEHGLAASAVVLISAGSLPKTSSGKVQRRATREAFLAGTLDVVLAWREALPTGRVEPSRMGASPSEAAPDSVAPWRSAAEVLPALSREVAALLGADARAVDVDAPLSGHGLDSLRALEVVHAVEAGWGVSPPVAFLLQGPSLREVAEWVSRAAADASPVLTASPASAASFVPLGQRALWFLQRMAPGSTAYHVARAVRFLTPVDSAALDRAFSALVSRHPTLRAAFPEEQGAPARRESESVPALVREAAAAWAESALRERLDAESHRAFDLERGPLLRVHLFTGAPRGDVLLLVMHHLVTDFWSLEVLAGELGALYAAEVQGTAASLPPPPPSASPVLQALEASLEGARGDAMVAWWRERLGGELPVLELPTSRPRPRLQSFRGATVTFTVPPETATRLKALARDQGATPFMALLAGYLAFLSRYTGQEDLVVGTPTAGRPRADLSRQMGYFVNPVALRARVPRTQSFTALLAHVRATVLDALDHQALPFARLVEQLQPRRDASRAPVFQAMFALQSGRPGREALGGLALGVEGARARVGELDVEAVPLRHLASAFDLSLMMAEVEGGFAASLEYCSDLFDADAAARMARHLGALFAAASLAPHAHVGDLPLLDVAERDRVLSQGRGAARVPGEAQAASGRVEPPGLLARFGAWAAETPDAVALVAGPARWSYAALDAWAGRLAARLRRHGVAREARVGVLLSRGGPESVVAFLAVLAAGGVVVPLDPTSPAERLEWMLRDSGARVLLSHASLARRLAVPEGVEVLSWESHGTQEVLDATPRASAAETGAAWPREAAAYVIYTSGSTGRPKGVVVTHQSMAHLARSSLALRPGPGTRVLQHASPAFDMSVWDYLMALTTGAALHVAPAGEVLAGDALYRVLRDERITSALLPPSVVALLPDAPLPDLAVLIVGGDVCPRELVTRFGPGRTFINGYGPTEVTVCATWEWSPPGDLAPGIGVPMAHVDTYVLDAALRPVPVGVAGELFVGGEGVARGYLGQPGLTAERFVPDPYGGAPGARLYRTGDRVRWSPDGRLEFLGRVDAQLKLRGFRIEPGEVEVALRELAGMRQAHVRVWSPPAGGEARLVAYVVPGPGAPLPPGEVRARLRARLPEQLVPVDLISLEALPMTTGGKVDARALPAPVRTVTAESAPRTPLEESLAKAWAEALGLPSVGVHSHFFDDLGGSSLAAVRTCARLRETLGQDVPITHLFEHPTVHSLARRLASESSPGPASDEKHQTRAEARRQVLQRRGGRNPRGNG
ncbi:amino acid adenylation domain-containing protein [Myxococcus sp. AM009]|uniref:non-ribosomal peptide synthetase n=1 Tax=Myxococcus sp. AM009 TaxID=2745137 RepID=UPI0015959169|nr:non-ribosomal peptide synthetase [Myxococcus sp. AM009]NVI99072.1 amino acid adenylation domain-containing protein [Myxococcus sp. AM009]